MWLWGYSLPKISPPGSVLHGTKWLLWRPRKESPTFHLKYRINRVNPKGKHNRPLKVAVGGPVLWLTPQTHTQMLREWSASHSNRFTQQGRPPIHFGRSARRSDFTDGAGRVQWLRKIMNIWSLRYGIRTRAFPNMKYEYWPLHWNIRCFNSCLILFNLSYSLRSWSELRHRAFLKADTGISEGHDAAVFRIEVYRPRNGFGYIGSLHEERHSMYPAQNPN
jgi:hypothetical protein